jgi:hypothetical protein
VSDLWTCLASNTSFDEGFEGRKLAAVGDEAVLVASILSQTHGIVISTQSAEEALDVLSGSHIFHHSGYERSGGQNPMNCAFMLDTELKIRDIIHAPLHHPVLAFLSQYPSTSPTPGLATSMLLSGFKSIVTATWYVTTSAAIAMFAYHLHRGLADDDGPLLAEAFYQSWLTNGRDGLVSLQDIPYALDDACAVLRAAGINPTRWGAFVHVGA